MTDLGTLGGSYTVGYGINGRGQVTGASYTPDGYDAFLYSNGQMIDLGILPGGGWVSAGLSINDFGKVAGQSTASAGDFHGFLYENGPMVDLNDLIDPAPGITVTSANAINNTGQITGGYTDSTGTDHAFLYSEGAIIDLGYLGRYL